jgi:hypothetical protein
MYLALFSVTLVCLVAYAKATAPRDNKPTERAQEKHRSYLMLAIILAWAGFFASLFQLVIELFL